jgi:fructose-bisphosphate aldolase class II
MIDASHCTLKENIELSKRVVEFAHPLGISVEAELGTIGIMGNSAEEGTKEITYTDPAQAREFVDKTGVDTLAVGIGTAHGLYPDGYVPKLRLDILQEIKTIVKLPLVLHGGSGNPDEEIAEAVRLGINKINISSDIKDPYYQQVRRTLEDKTLREPNQIYRDAIEVMKKVMEQKMDLFGCTDTSQYYRL